MALAVALAAAACAPSARANVYATNVKLNGSQTPSVDLYQGYPLTISYILNEAATEGVTIKISSGGTPIRTIAIPSGFGTSKGSNAVVWDGKTGTGSAAPLGTYSVSITAGATGYTNWTQISDDSSPSLYFYRPRGIAVNNNTNSPFYGRIFVGEVGQGPGFSTNAWGDVPGLYKLNADGSYSDDGAGRYSTAGYNFSDGSHYDGADNPIDMKVKEDDRVYWNNWVGYSEIVAADMLLTNYQIVMPESYYVANPYFNPGSSSYGGWKSFNVTDVTTDHARIYLADPNFPSGGVWYWPMTNGSVDVNDPNGTAGYQAVATGGDLTLRCDGFAVDAFTNVYVIQNRANPDINMRAACFTNWDGQTTLSSGAAWVVGQSDDSFRNEYNMALDSVQNPRYLAVSMSSLTAGGIRILSVTNGETIFTNLDVTATYHGVSWDYVGNLYGGSQSAARIRVWSPPGTNQATTIAPAQLQLVAPPTVPQITSLSLSGGTVTIAFSGGAADTADKFALQSASQVAGPYIDTSSATITQTAPGVFRATVASSGSASFYRIKR